MKEKQTRDRLKPERQKEEKTKKQRGSVPGGWVGFIYILDELSAILMESDMEMGK